MYCEKKISPTATVKAAMQKKNHPTESEEVLVAGTKRKRSQITAENSISADSGKTSVMAPMVIPQQVLAPQLRSYPFSHATESEEEGISPLEGYS